MVQKVVFVVSALLAFFSFSDRASAQLPNKILIEEATNASCPPCAAQNPILATFLLQHPEVIHLAYHAWWPGSNDPMYRNDIIMNTARISYYGFDKIGVPTCVVNGQYAAASSGWYQGAPGDTNALAATLSSQDVTQNPVAISIQRFVVGDSEHVVVKLTALSDIIAYKLRVAVVESDHTYTNAGSNGETFFPDLVRKMLPDKNGTPVSLKAGQSTALHFKYKHNTSSWTTDKLSVVAFLQNDADNTVYAASQSNTPPTPGFESVGDNAMNAPLALHIQSNPVTGGILTGSLLHSTEPEANIILVDELGRIVAEDIAIDGSIRLSVANLPSGAYRLIASTNKSSKEALVMIAH